MRKGLVEVSGACSGGFEKGLTAWGIKQETRGEGTFHKSQRALSVGTGAAEAQVAALEFKTDSNGSH